jgi:small ligand-binding sensory domain FIST
MPLFAVGHATHHDWAAALALAVPQVEAQLAIESKGPGGPPNLGFCYFTDVFAPHAKALLDALQHQWPAVQWVGCCGFGVAAGAAEYVDEPALALMLGHVPEGRFEVFSGARPLQRIRPYTALVHADPQTPDLPELISEMSDRVGSGFVFGGVAASRGDVVQLANGVFSGGLSGVAFGDEVKLLSRVTQGCQPLGPVRRVTAARRNLVLELDGEPALPVLLRDAGVRLDQSREALQRLRGTFVGLTDARSAALGRGRAFGEDVRVRHLVGLDPAQQAVAVAEEVQPGMQLAFCERDVAAARRDLVRVCSELREELAGDGSEPPRHVRGALFISCNGRGGAHFGGPSAELKIVQHALGDVPLVGFFAAGEIAHRHLYGYTGVLTVFAGAG